MSNHNHAQGKGRASAAIPTNGTRLANPVKAYLIQAKMGVSSVFIDGRVVVTCAGADVDK